MSNSARDSRRSSKSSSISHEKHKSSTERREKAKSSQTYDSPRRGSRQTESTLDVVSERRGLKTRTNSAPVIESRAIRPNGRMRIVETQSQYSNDDKKSTAPRVTIGAYEDGQDDDEVAGVVGTLRHFEPFPATELSESIPDINIAVIGAEGVGKSTFVQKALDLPSLVSSQAMQSTISLDGNDYLVRLLELPIDDVDIDDDDNTVAWPDTIDSKIMPKIDGALTLYDVQDRGSLEDIPQMLNAIDKSGIPSLLVSCKCDTPIEEREVDPFEIEQKAKNHLKDLRTVQTSAKDPESHLRGVDLLLRAIVTSSLDQTERRSPAHRKRAQSNATRSVSPRPRDGRGHIRAKSEHSGASAKDQRHSRHDSSLAPYATGDRSQASHEPEEDMQGSFLFEESNSEASATSTDSTLFEPEASVTNPSNSTPPLDEGVTFDELVDQMLIEPTSKADNKFTDIFLALYRKFAPPGLLLEAMVERFDALYRNSNTNLTKGHSEMRILDVMVQWVSTYPGDFAYPKTKTRVRTFAGKLSKIRTLAAAARDMVKDLEAVVENDDTSWACNDKDRTSTGNKYKFRLSNTASILIDDPTFVLSDGLVLTPPAYRDDSLIVSTTANQSSSATALNVDVSVAQQQAKLLVPLRRQPITKIQWRQLMEYPDDIIAQELTRIDWVMFCSFRPRDLVRHVSLTDGQKETCTNLIFLDRMAEHFNQVALWVENFVLLRDKPKHRALMLEKFMSIARELRKLNNYNALGAIIAGVNATPIHRLAATRELIPPSVGKDWMKLELLMAPSRSHAAYRLAWENTNGERIPYLPLHRRDLVSAEQGNKTFAGDAKENKINWKKFEVMGEVIVGLQKAQAKPYLNLGANRGELIKELILDVKLVKDVDNLFERSKQVEPVGIAAAASGGSSSRLKEFFKR